MKMRKINQKLSSHKNQSGVILVLALVILLVLTMLIVSSMNSTNMQVLMTGNTQYHTQALNDAEVTLRFAENSIEQFATNVTVIPGSGYYNLTVNNNTAIDFSSFSWDSNSAAIHTTASRNSFYVIEYIKQVPLSNGAPIMVSQNNKITGDRAHLYRITARSTSARGALRLVQSVYVTTAAPLL